MTAEQMVKEYTNLKRELQVLEFQIGQFRGVSEEDIIDSMCRGGHDDSERVQTSGTSDKTASVAIRFRRVMEKENDEWFDFLWSRYRYVKEEIDFFESCLRFMPDHRGDILMDLTMKVSWEVIAAKYDISRTTIQNRRNKAMQELRECYRMRDLQTETYMLS
jgi:hypothetical protein